jgi:cyclohexanecarboxylate-CoA ligase
MELGVVLTPQRARAARAAGLWPDRLAIDDLDQHARERPNQAALTDHNSMTGRSTTLSYRHFKRLTDRIALSLIELGIGPGDVVGAQLPNWWQMAALHFACLRIGAITNPLMPIFRERELGYMLSFAECRLLVVPQLFRGFDYPAMIARLRPQLPALAHVKVVGGDGADSFDAHFVDRRLEEAADAEARLAARRPKPDDVILLNYTSGTTGHPKGVMHSANTLNGGMLPWIRRIGLDRRDVVLMASPLAHLTGFIYGMLMPLSLGARTVLQDIWSPVEAARLISEEAVTFTMGATPFLADLADTPAWERYSSASLRIFLSAGAPIPRVLVERASKRLGAAVLSGWGMTENGCVTCCKVDDPPEQVFGTDGGPIEGAEVRVVDADSRPVQAGTEGRLQARGPCHFLGYLKKPELYGVDAEGWFETGDLAQMTADGYIRISGRSKDIIIRGGENIPVVEVEEALYRHPAVQDAAVVAMPDPRLAERACAFVTLKPGATIDFAGLQRHLETQRLSKTYWPERLEIIEAMPRTASGKIQKFVLREQAKHFVTA